MYMIQRKYQTIFYLKIKAILLLIVTSTFWMALCKGKKYLPGQFKIIIKANNYGGNLGYYLNLCTLKLKTSRHFETFSYFFQKKKKLKFHVYHLLRRHFTWNVQPYFQRKKKNYMSAKLNLSMHKVIIKCSTYSSSRFRMGFPFKTGISFSLLELILLKKERYNFYY